MVVFHGDFHPMVSNPLKKTSQKKTKVQVISGQTTITPKPECFGHFWGIPLIPIHHHLKGDIILPSHLIPMDHGANLLAEANPRDVSRANPRKATGINLGVVLPGGNPCPKNPRVLGPGPRVQGEWTCITGVF